MPIKNTNRDSKHSLLRKKMRLLRSSLALDKQAQASQTLYTQILNDPDFQKADTVAFYQAFDGEIDPKQALSEALKRGKRCFLPFIDKNNDELRFVEALDSTVMETNLYGIQQPQYSEKNSLDSIMIDIVYMPLVAFDESGTRMGMGKGYYDKNLAFMSPKIIKMKPKVPKLIGLAHEFQRVERLERAEWDIPLDKVITDQKTYIISD